MGLLEVLGLPRAASLAAAGPPALPPTQAGGAVGADGVSTGAKAEAGGGEREQAQARRLIAALGKSYAQSVAKAEPEIQAQPVAAIQKSLAAELAALKQGRAEVDALDPLEGAKRMRRLDTGAADLARKAETQRRAAADAQRWLRERGEEPVQALVRQVDALDADGKAIYAPRLAQIRGWLAGVRARLDAADFDAVIQGAGNLRNHAATLSAAVASHAVEYPKFQALRKKVVEMVARIRGSGLLDADGTRALAELDTAVSAADALGPIQGYGAARNSLNTIVAKARVLRDNNANFQDYTAERAKTAKAIEPLRSDAQAGKLKAELARLDAQLAAADALAKRTDGGALKALTALKAIQADCAATKQLAGKLAAAEKQLPDLKKKLETGGVPKDKVEETARMALKVLVEESCSADDAVKMAKDASGYRGEGMDEVDAIMSSRVKKSLEDSGLPADHAQSIGRNVRAGGSATADDAKALAQAMRGVSKKAIDTLNKAGVKSECCRGAVTDAMPDLAGVHPDGWPDTASWDEVPGVYYGGKKNTVVVGTVEEGGKRVVPGPGEGPNKPNPHGASDLFGHEAGHAFDAADGGGKLNNDKFKKARDEDIAGGDLKGSQPPGGGTPGSDDYFLTVAEGGANDYGLRETFAESFAMHFTTAMKRWPKLEAFWAANPWGI